MSSFCTRCGSALNPGVRFCPKCGNAIAALAAPPPPVAPPRTPPPPQRLGAPPVPPPAAKSSGMRLLACLGCVGVLGLVLVAAIVVPWLIPSDLKSSRDGTYGSGGEAVDVTSDFEEDQVGRNEPEPDEEGPLISNTGRKKPPTNAPAETGRETPAGTRPVRPPAPPRMPDFDPARAPKKVLVSQKIEPSAQPQTVNHEDRVKVTLPGGLIREAQTLTIAEIPEDSVPQDGELRFRRIAAYDISLGDLHRFDKEITVEVPYDPAQLNPACPAGDQIMARYWDTPGQKWVFFRVRVDPDRHVIATSLDHLTLIEWVVIAGVTILINEAHAVYENVTYDVYHTPVFTILYEKAAINSSNTSNDTTWRREGGGKLGGITSLNWGWTKNDTVRGYRKDVPVYIQDLGACLEEAHSAYVIRKGYRMQNGPIIVKVDSAFVSSQPGAAGAYEKIYDRIHVDTTNLNSPTDMLLATGHELFHAIQHADLSARQMSSATGPAYQWWIEAEADYAACRVARTLNMMGGQGDSHGVNPKLLERRLPETGAVAGYSEMEYDKAHFIDYLVAQRGVDFKPLHDAVMTYDGHGDAILGPLEKHLEAELQERLYSVYRDFAAWFLLSAESPIGTLDPAASCAEASETLTLPPDPGQPATPLDHTFQLPRQYSAKLWAVRAEPAPEGESRRVVVESLDQPAGTYLDLFVIGVQQRTVGAPKSRKVLTQKGEACNLEIGEEEVLYILGSNTREGADSNVKVRVRDDTVTLTIDPPGIEEGEPNKLYKFTATARNIPGTVTRVECEWDFGDGSDPAPFTAKPTAGGGYQGAVTHRYVEPKEYEMTVRLYERAPRARELLAETGVTISLVEKPQVTLDPETVQGEPGAAITFTAKAAGAPSDAWFAWSFGDGSKAIRTERPSASHTFKAAGDFAIIVQMRDKPGTVLAEASGSAVIRAAAAGVAGLLQPPFPNGYVQTASSTDPEEDIDSGITVIAQQTLQRTGTLDGTFWDWTGNPRDPGSGKEEHGTVKMAYIAHIKLFQVKPSVLAKWGGPLGAIVPIDDAEHADRDFPYVASEDIYLAKIDPNNQKMARIVGRMGDTLVWVSVETGDTSGVTYPAGTNSFKTDGKQETEEVKRDGRQFWDLLRKGR